MIDYVSRPGEVLEDGQIHTCDFYGNGFDLSFLRGSVRETGKGMLCV